MHFAAFLDLTPVEALVARARDQPDRCAYAVGPDSVTYGALLDQVTAVAYDLSARGLGAGARCALVLPTGLDFVRILYGVQALGAVPAAVNPALPPDTLRRRIQLVRATLAVAPREVCAILGPAGAGEGCALAPAEDLGRSGRNHPIRTSAADAVAYLQFTSGTTGDAKAAVILNRNLQASLAGTFERLRVRPDDVFASWVPLHHNLGLVRFVFGPLYFGCPSHLVAASIANLRRWLETMARSRATITAGPDSGYRLAARVVDPRGLDLSSLRFATDGGEAARASTIEEFERRFSVPGVVRPAYGLAEATLGVTSLGPGEPLRIGPGGALSCGRPFEGVEVRVAAADGGPAPPGVDGEILVRGACVFAGYVDDPAGTAAVLKEGWLHTGDVGCVDADNHLYVKGRRRALIKRAGAIIVPREVEDASDRVDGVEMSAALGIPRGSFAGTEDLVVVVEARPQHPADATRIAREVAREVTGAVGSAPNQVRLVDPGTIPRTASGKTRYDELQRLITGGD